MTTFLHMLEENILCGNLSDLYSLLKHSKDEIKLCIQQLKKDSNVIDPIYFSLYYGEECCALLLLKYGFPHDIVHHNNKTAEWLARQNRLDHFIWGLNLFLSDRDKDKEMLKSSLKAEVKGFEFIKSNDPHELSKATFNDNTSVDKMGNTFIHLSVSQENIGSIISVFTYSLIGVNVNHQNKNGDTALHIAAKEGLFEMCRTLLLCGTSPLIRDKLGLMAVDYVSSEHHNDVYQLLQRYSPGLSEGIQRSDYNAVSKAVDCWVNVHSKMFDCGQTAYDYCTNNVTANKRTVGIVHKVEQNAVVLDLIHNVLANNTEGAKLLLRKMTSGTVLAALKMQHPHTGLTIIGAAVRNCNLFLIKEMIRLGAPLNSLRMYDEPLLHFAITCGCSYNILTVLLAAGADASTRDSNGLSVIHRCINNGISADHLYDLLTRYPQNLIYVAERAPRFINYVTPREYAAVFHREDIVQVIDKAVDDLFKNIRNRNNKEILMQLAIRFYGVANFPPATDEEIYKKEFLRKIPEIEESCKTLFLAIHNNDMATMKRYNEVDYRDVNGYTSLIKAIALERIDMARWILAERPNLSTMADDEGLTPLHYAYSLPAAVSGEYVTMLLGTASGASPNERLENAADMYGRLPCQLRTLKDTDDRVARSLERVRKLGPSGKAN